MRFAILLICLCADVVCGIVIMKSAIRKKRLAIVICTACASVIFLALTIQIPPNLSTVFSSPEAAFESLFDEAPVCVLYGDHTALALTNTDSMILAESDAGWRIEDNAQYEVTMDAFADSSITVFYHKPTGDTYVDISYPDDSAEKTLKDTLNSTFYERSRLELEDLWIQKCAFVGQVSGSYTYYMGDTSHQVQLRH